MDEEKPVVKYSANVKSPLVNGDVKLEIQTNKMIVSSVFDAIEIPFAEIISLSLDNYVVTIKADSGDYVLTKLGNWCQPFYDTLYGEFKKAVLRALFVKESPAAIAECVYEYDEKGMKGSRSAAAHVYGNSVVALPPNLMARRIPLCFVNGMEKGNFELTLKIDADETYKFGRLGYAFDPFVGAVEKSIRDLREKTFANVMDIDYSLSTVQASQLAKMMPQGAAASIAQITAVAPSFAAALESKISKTRAAEPYNVFKTMCDPASIFVGFRKKDAFDEEASAGADKDKEKNDDPYVLWMIVPSPDGQTATVEFAIEGTATFVYRTGGDFNVFAKQLNRALEAINFRREAIWIADAELRKPEYADYYMAAKRTAALQLVRSNFKGRVIHTTPEAWERNLKALIAGK